MKKLFISYRRKDWALTRNLVEELRARLYANVFLDIDSITETDFESTIPQNLASSDAVLLILSEYTFDPNRIHKDDDWVRREVAMALELGKPILLIGVDGRVPPPAAELPENIRQITRKQTIKFTADFFDAAVDKLVAMIANPNGDIAIPLRRDVEQAEARRIRRQRIQYGFALAALILIIGLGALVWRQSTANGSTTPTLTPTTQIAQLNTLPPTTNTPAITLTPSATTVNTATSLPNATLTSKPPLPTLTHTPAATPIPIVNSNAEWKPHILVQQFNGVDMVLVPPGCFMMGTASGGESDERPTAKLCFPTFWIDLTEVTNSQFDTFKGKATTPSHWTGPNRPRETISWTEANTFCALRGARLPTEAEWEYAARGPDNLIYPWGNIFVAANVVYSANSGNQTADVGAKIRKSGASWVSALDLSGNVWEWVYSINKPYPYATNDGRESDTNDNNPSRARRGGSWAVPEPLMRSADRNEYSQSYPGDFKGGFRCARS